MKTKRVRRRVYRCPACQSDAILYLGSAVSAEDDFRVTADIFECLTCGAGVRISHATGKIERIQAAGTPR